MSKNDKSVNNEFITLDEMNVILQIPEKTRKLTIIAEIGKGDEKQSVSKILKKKDIKSARKDFLDYVPEGDDFKALFVLNPEFQKFMDKYADSGLSFEEIVEKWDKEVSEHEPD